MKTLIVIPARIQSSRLPQKMLLAETGLPLIVHTCRAASASQRAESIIVAADDEAIYAAAAGAGFDVEMTATDHVSGTDRVAEVAARHPQYDIIVNVQGDEPEIAGEAIDLAVSLLEKNPHINVATLATPIRDAERLHDAGCVKVVTDASGRAMYFSRSPIPCPRTFTESMLSADPPNFLQHVGLYAYRRKFLLEFSSLPPSTLEPIESLEQLRVLSAGEAIQVGLIDDPVIGIDTIEDYRQFVSRQVKR